MRSSKADRIPILLTRGELKLVAVWFVVLSFLAALCFVFAGCATVPPGYDADTTPGHNGEQWIGGETPPAISNH
ncbi:MAG: hypothetical protein V1929_00275 [bacterium]